MGRSTWIDSYWRILLCIKLIRVQGESTLLTTRRREEKPSPWENDPDITGEYKIDIGLRRRPIEEFFIKGPIPVADYVLALKLGGKTAGVYMLIHHRTVYSRRRWITLPPYALEEWGISIDAKTDALKRLAQAGLIAVQATEGSFPSGGAASETAELETEESDMTVDLALEARRLNAIGDPLLYRIGVAGLISHYGREPCGKPLSSKPRAPALCRSQRRRPGVCRGVVPLNGK